MIRASSSTPSLAYSAGELHEDNKLPSRQERSLARMIDSRLALLFLSRLPTIRRVRGAGRGFSTTCVPGDRASTTMIQAVLFLCNHLHKLDDVPAYLEEYMALFFSATDAHPTVERSRGVTDSLFPDDNGITYGTEEVIRSDDAQRAIFNRDIEFSKERMNRRVLYRLVKSNPGMWTESVICAYNDKRFRNTDISRYMLRSILDEYIPNIVMNTPSLYTPPNCDEILQGIQQMVQEEECTIEQAGQWIARIMGWGFSFTGVDEKISSVRADENDSTSRRAVSVIVSNHNSYRSILVFCRLISYFNERDSRSAVNSIRTYLFRLVRAADRLLGSPVVFNVSDSRHTESELAVQCMKEVYPPDPCDRLLLLIESHWMLFTAHRFLTRPGFRFVLESFTRAVEVSPWIVNGTPRVREDGVPLTCSDQFSQRVRTSTILQWMSQSRCFLDQSNVDPVFVDIMRAVGHMITPEVLAQTIHHVSIEQSSVHQLDTLDLFMEVITHHMDPGLKLPYPAFSSSPYVCPIGHTVVWDPVRSPHVKGNVLFERRYLKQWIESCEECPLTRKSMKVEDLIPAWSELHSIRARTQAWVHHLLRNNKRKSRKRRRASNGGGARMEGRRRVQHGYNLRKRSSSYRDPSLNA